MVFDAVIAARLRPMTNAEAASNFIVFPFWSVCDENTISDYGDMTTELSRASPAMTAPVTVVPTPVMAMPMAVPPVTMAPVLVVPPADFFGLQTINILLRDHRGFGGLAVRWHQSRSHRNRRQRRGLRARCKRDRACNKSNGELQKVAALHDISPLRRGGDGMIFAASR
jgi:hypothetical protein